MLKGKDLSTCQALRLRANIALVYDDKNFGPALARVRKARGFRQKDVAEKLGVSESVPSRLEAAGSNPTLKRLTRYLGAIGATLTDLDKAILTPDPLAQEIIRDDERLREDPVHRARTLELLRRFETPELSELQSRLEAIEADVEEIKLAQPEKARSNDSDN